MQREKCVIAPDDSYQLYDEDLHAKSGILKLVSCHACGADVADKYVEVDGTLLLIDLALQVSPLTQFLFCFLLVKKHQFAWRVNQ